MIKSKNQSVKEGQDLFGIVGWIPESITQEEAPGWSHRPLTVAWLSHEGCLGQVQLDGCMSTCLWGWQVLGLFCENGVTLASGVPGVASCWAPGPRS